MLYDHKNQPMQPNTRLLHARDSECVNFTTYNVLKQSLTTSACFRWIFAMCFYVLRIVFNWCYYCVFCDCV